MGRGSEQIQSCPEHPHTQKRTPLTTEQPFGLFID